MGVVAELEMAEEEAVDAFSKGDGLPRVEEEAEVAVAGCWCCGSDGEGAFAGGAIG